MKADRGKAWRWGRRLPWLLLIALVVVGVLSLRGYGRLTDETLIAEIRFTPLDRHLYRARLFRIDLCRNEDYLLAGDQWRIDTRFIKWKGWAVWLGLDARYRLERIEGRYARLDEERSRPRTSYDLSGGHLFDIARFAEALGPLNVFIDARYGSSTYQAIDPDSVYRIYRSQSGILSRREPILRMDGGVPIIEIRPGCRSGQGDGLQRFLGWLMESNGP